MAFNRATNRKIRTVSLALLLPTLADRPRTLAELNALFDAQGVTVERRKALRNAWANGGVVFFVAATGQYATRTSAITPAYLEREFSRALGQSRSYLRDLVRQLISGSISLDEFRRAAGKEIEDAHWDAALLLVGPLLYSISPMMATVLELIAAQMRWLDGLIADILAGRQRLDGSLLRRLGMYAGSGWSALQELHRQLAFMEGLREERNVLGIAEHCGGCLGETDRGWVPIGTLIPVGERTCLSNCQCHFEFR